MTNQSLAVREFSDKQIRTRLEASATTPGFGLFGASRELLNIIYLQAIKYDLDPSTDITAYQGRPFFTIDGRVRLMRRHPQYQGYRTRPLTKDEKEAWGYKVEEVVIECTIRTRDWGDIVARGKVSPDEFGRQPVAKAHPQEMAEKRAIARASRMAFGQDVPSEADALDVLEERDDAVRNDALAARYTEIYPEDDNQSIVAPRALAPAIEAPTAEEKAAPRDLQTGEVLDTPAAPKRTYEEVFGDDDPPAVQPVAAKPNIAAWADNRRLVARATELGLTGIPVLNTRSSVDVVAEANAVLQERITNTELDRKLAAQQGVVV